MNPEPDRAARIAEVTAATGFDSVLMQAEGIVNGARSRAYGHPTPNHAKIARLWEAYLANLAEVQGLDVAHCVRLAPQDVAQMMLLLKVARLQYSPFHYDSMVDIAGYTACIERMGESDLGEAQ